MIFEFTATSLLNSPVHGFVGALTVGLSCIIGIAFNLRDHSLPLSWIDTALTPAVIRLAEALTLSEVEVAGEKEFRAIAIAVAYNRTGSINCEV